MSFKDKNYAARSADPMFYHSERKFEQYYPAPWAPTGISAKDAELNTWTLPPRERHRPDYWGHLPWGSPKQDMVFIEVQGTGKGGGSKFKFKKLKLEALKIVNRDVPVWFWLWDDETQCAWMISYPSLTLLIGQGHAEDGKFVDILRDGTTVERMFWAVTTATLDTSPLAQKFHHG